VTPAFVVSILTSAEEVSNDAVSAAERIEGDTREFIGATLIANAGGLGRLERFVRTCSVALLRYASQAAVLREAGG